MTAAVASLRLAGTACRRADGRRLQRVELAGRADDRRRAGHRHRRGHRVPSSSLPRCPVGSRSIDTDESRRRGVTDRGRLRAHPRRSRAAARRGAAGRGAIGFADRRLRLRRQSGSRQAPVDGGRGEPSSPTVSSITSDNPRERDPGDDHRRDRRGDRSRCRPRGWRRSSIDARRSAKPSHRPDRATSSSSPARATSRHRSSPTARSSSTIGPLPVSVWGRVRDRHHPGGSEFDARVAVRHPLPDHVLPPAWPGPTDPRQGGPRPRAPHAQAGNPDDGRHRHRRSSVDRLARSRTSAAVSPSPTRR